MATVLDAEDLIEIEDQTAFNLAVWEKMLADPELARLPFRIESDRYGNTIMAPPPNYEHGKRQSLIVLLLGRLLPHGFVATESPVSTGEGVKGIDIAWISRERDAGQSDQTCLTLAPEICVEVLSPGNSRPEMRNKRALYFATGAEEVWFCHRDGRMEFFLKEASETAAASRLCPEFPRRIEIEA